MSDNAIRRIQAGDLRKMSDREGLILQGCGGDPQEWLEGINEMLADAGILRNGSQFERASLFEYDGHTNMLFDFEGVDLDVGKLAMWRLTTYGTIGGTWLSDYVPNRLGGFLEKSELGVEKPSWTAIFLTLSALRRGRCAKLACGIRRKNSPTAFSAASATATAKPCA